MQKDFMEVQSAVWIETLKTGASAITHAISSRCSRLSPTSFQVDVQGSHPRHFKPTPKAVTHVISSRCSRQSPTSFQADAHGSHPVTWSPSPQTAAPVPEHFSRWIRSSARSQRWLQTWGARGQEATSPPSGPERRWLAFSRRCCRRQTPGTSPGTRLN